MPTGTHDDVADSLRDAGIQRRGVCEAEVHPEVNGRREVHGMQTQHPELRNQEERRHQDLRPWAKAGNFSKATRDKKCTILNRMRVC